MRRKKYRKKPGTPTPRATILGNFSSDNFLFYNLLTSVLEAIYKICVRSVSGYT